MLAEIKKGDKVITSGGIHGIVSNVKEGIVSVKIADNVKIDVEKSTISIWIIQPLISAGLQMERELVITRMMP